MKKITIGFSSSKLNMPIGSMLIKLFEGTKFSHCYVQWYMQSVDRTITYEASFSGVRFLGPWEFLELAEPIESFDMEISDESFNRGLQFSVDYLGKGYGFGYLFGMAIKRILKLFKINVKNPFQDGNKTHPCVEILARYLEKTLDKKLFDNVEDIGLNEMHDKILEIVKS